MDSLKVTNYTIDVNPGWVTVVATPRFWDGGRGVSMKYYIL